VVDCRVPAVTVEPVEAAHRLGLAVFHRTGPEPPRRVHRPVVEPAVRAVRFRVGEERPGARPQVDQVPAGTEACDKDLRILGEADAADLGLDIDRDRLADARSLGEDGARGEVHPVQRADAGVP
jgi:hypothetical protein